LQNDQVSHNYNKENCGSVAWEDEYPGYSAVVGREELQQDLQMLAASAEIVVDDKEGDSDFTGWYIILWRF